jgi:uncharacterized protein with HEPN domain
MKKDTIRDPKLYLKEIIEHTQYIEEYTADFTQSETTSNITGQSKKGIGR